MGGHGACPIGSSIGLVPSARVHEGRQAHFLATGEAVGVSGCIARIEGRRVHRVLRVQMEFPEERLPERLVVGARGALFGPGERRGLPLCPGQARTQEEEHDKSHIEPLHFPS